MRKRERAAPFVDFLTILFMPNVLNGGKSYCTAPGNSNRFLC